MTDFRKILVRYIAHVGDCEGVYFLSCQPKLSGLDFDEWQALLDCRDEAHLLGGNPPYDRSQDL